MTKNICIKCIISTLIIVLSVCAYAQTPFDTFAPETSRIILDADSIAVWRAAQRRDTILCAIVADLHNEQLLLVDIRRRSVLAHAPMPEDTKNWLSVDPLSDKYPNTSGYMYCNGNPVMLVDPDGKKSIVVDESGVIISVDESIPEDRISVQKSDGLVSSEDYAPGTFKIIAPNDKNKADESTKTFTMFINNSDAAINTFKFLTKETSVEWFGLIGVKGKLNQNYLATNSSSQNSSAVSNELCNRKDFQKGGALYMIHNHPSNNPKASQTDITAYYNFILNQQKNIPSCFVYTVKDGRFHPYSYWFPITSEIESSPQPYRF